MTVLDPCSLAHIVHAGSGALSKRAFSKELSLWPAIHPMATNVNNGIAYTLARRTGADPDAEHTADAVVALLREIDAALTPLIGHRGVVALYNRSLSQVVGSHHWLAAAHVSNQSGGATALRSAIAGQERSIAYAGGNALLQAIQELLASLVGLPLTARLLDSVWAQPAIVRPAPQRSPAPAKSRSSATRRVREDGNKRLEAAC